MPDLVRVRDGKWEFNRGRAFAEANGLQILEGEPTHLSDGRPRPTTRANGRPVKPRTTVEAEARKKRSGKKSGKQLDDEVAAIQRKAIEEATEGVPPKSAPDPDTTDNQ